jgi:hypothetical protein
MNIRLAIVTLLLAALLPGCSSAPKRAPHPGVGILDLKQLRIGWFSSRKKHRDLVVRALDGKAVRDPKLPAGLALPPGVRSLTLSAQHDNAVVLGRKLGGNIGARLGRQLDSNAASSYDRTLVFSAISGHDYVAHMRKHGDKYDYWIEDVTGDRIVADTRL